MSIPLGYEVGTGKLVEIPLRHLVVTGQTQDSGKTTTLEALITRSNLRGVAFVTKRGESSFHVATPIPPYFRERTDWPFVASILEATLSEKLKFQRAWIMKLCQSHDGKDGTWKKPATLADVQRNVETALEKARGINESVYTELREYLQMVVPQLERLPYTTQLELARAVNVMDLTGYDFPVQALVVRSVIEWIRLRERETVAVIPEAWKFAPKQRGSPVRFAAEEFIREGAALRNYLWVDSQDLAGVADVLMRQIGVWIFGVQKAPHEIERTLAHIPDSLGSRPRKSDIAMLGKGQFIVCFERCMFKVYVQPAWMASAHAEAIARGEEEVGSAREILSDFDAARPAVKVPNEKEQKANSPIPEVRPTEEPKTRAGNPLPGNEHPGETADAAPRPGQGAQGTDETEETVWKEKFTELAALVLADGSASPRAKEIASGYYDRKAAAEAATNSPTGAGADSSRCASPPVTDPLSNLPDRLAALDEIANRAFQLVLARAEKDPRILQVLVSKPELRVNIERQTIAADGSTLRGALALLISKKFFEAPQNGNTTFNELKRLGRAVAKPNVYRELDKLAELGFLTKEETGYQAVAGMQVYIHNVKGEK